MISFLLGSGFSIPEGVRSVSQLNERLQKIEANEICVNTSRSAFFIEGQDIQNDIIGLPERKFVESFLDFYNQEIIDGDFHYEDFYDFYTSFLREEINAEQINEFCDKFNTDLLGDYGKRDPHNRINDFNTTFNQLLGSLLNNPTYYKDVSLGNYLLYDNFIDFLKRMIQVHDVKVHSLNHDIFFDHLASKVSGLWEHYSDGFELQGSNFYGSLRREFINKGVRIPKEYKVKLKRFTGDFSGKLSLFKLHGSIDNYIAYNIDPTIRLKKDYAISEFFIEHKPNGQEKYKMSRLHDSIFPDFLSGSTEKIYRYDNAYYKILFDHFKDNLTNSETLIVIGYGFQDKGINELLVKHFLSNDKKMIVIDINKPDSDLIEGENCSLIRKSITEVASDELIELM